MLEIYKEKTDFWNHLQELFNASEKEKTLLDRLKKESWKKLSYASIPTENSPGYEHFPLDIVFQARLQCQVKEYISSELRSKVENLTPKESEGRRAVFLNGSFSKELSDFSSLPKEVWAGSLEEASLPFQSFLKASWQREIADESIFSLLNKAFFLGGLFFYVPASIILKQPLHIIRITTGEKSPLLAKSRLHITLGKHSQASMTFSSDHLGESEFSRSLAIDITQEEGSSLFLSTVHDQDKEPIWEYEGLFASLKKGALLKHCFLTRGSLASRQEARVRLIGEGSEADLSGLWILGNSHHCSSNIIINHEAPFTRSFQFFKGILGDSSTSGFRGKILVEPAALKTEAFQLNNNLILSPQAKSYSEPQLEIFADDVKASHGATVGQVDSDALFYLRTRGFSERDAKSLLILSFAKEILGKLPNDPFLQESALSFLKKSINNKA